MCIVWGKWVELQQGSLRSLEGFPKSFNGNSLVGGCDASCSVGESKSEFVSNRQF